MKQAALFVMMLGVLCTATYAVTVYQNDYEGETVGAGAPGWNWGTTVTTHSAAFADDGTGNIVIQHTGTTSNTTGAAADARFGSKWDITLVGNTSADPADYTVSFDVRNVSGDWDPIEEGFAIVTNNPAVGTDQYGHGFPNQSLAIADGWIHVEYNLADFANDWWQGTQWDLTQPTWSFEIGQPWPGISVPDGTSFTQVWLFDNLKITMGSEIEAHDPVVLPLNGDGTSGTLVSQSTVEVTLNCQAGGDPNTLHDPQYPMNPDIVGHYIYMTNGTEDPNLYPLDYVSHAHNADPYLTDPNVWYGPVTLFQGTTYSWKVEEAMDDGTGNPFGFGDPNNIMGPVWTFTTVSATPRILAGPENALADLSGNASFTVTCGPAADHYRWFKVVGDQDTAENGQTDDLLLTDSGIYSGTQTTTLLITGATEADEGQFYCIAYNGDPTDGGIASLPSVTAKLWYPRLVSHFPFETVADNATPDIVSGFDAVLMQAGTGSLPGLNTTDAIVGTSCLLLDNPDTASTDGQYAQIPAGVVDYQDMTISLWIRPNSVIGWARALDFGNGATDYLFITPDAGWGVMRYATKVDDGAEQLLETSSLAAGQWYHVAVTISGDTGRLYRNGELIATNTGMTIDPIDVGAVLNYIGKSQWPDPEFNGMIDDLKIYNYALSTVDVAQEYLAVRGDWVCNRETYDLQNYDTNGNCLLDLADFASLAARWLEDDRIYPVQ